MRAYLQVACAGLGFDIGEVWWTQNENGSSTVAALGEFVGRESHVGVRLDTLPRSGWSEWCFNVVDESV